MFTNKKNDFFIKKAITAQNSKAKGNKLIFIFFSKFEYYQKKTENQYFDVFFKARGAF